MKHFPFFLLLALCPLHAQEEQPPQQGANEQVATQQEFLNLPEEKRTEFIEKFGEASRFFQQKRIFECLEVLADAEKIFPDSAELHNLRGSCYVEMRAFDKASASFGEAIRISPKNNSIRFNIAEVLFVTKQWQESLNLFEEIFKDIPPENKSLARLVEFKILLCKNKLGQDDEVLILAEKYDYQDDSPYYYYAQAALAYDKEDLLEAEQWLARARRIFQDPNITAPWQDTLVEYGYIKSFYGDDDAAIEE
jgi:tetratricopeptide (TPR) repeat protein